MELEERGDQLRSHLNGVAALATQCSTDIEAGVAHTLYLGGTAHIGLDVVVGLLGEVVGTQSGEEVYDLDLHPVADILILLQSREGLREAPRILL